MGKRTVLEVMVADLEKRKHPGKHYVYILEVSWSEGITTVIYRRYSDFFEFQCELLERFPEEAGAKDPAQRIIPFLPGKKLLGRSHTRAVAEKRKEKLNEYCRALIRLPQKISDDDFVIDFFNVRPEDITPTTGKPAKKSASTEKIQEISDPLVLERFVAVADYEKQKKNECSLEAGQTVEVIDKNANGWWFVNVDDFNEGWVPATYLEPLYGASEDIGAEVLEPGEEEVHIAMSGYTPQNDDEIGFEKGSLLEVFEKNLDGWWRVRYQGREGFAPAAFLQRYHGAVIKNEVTTGAQVVSSVKEAITPSTNGKSSSWKPIDKARVTSPTANGHLKLKPTNSHGTSSKPAESAAWKHSEPRVTIPDSTSNKTAESAHVTSPKSPLPKPKPFAVHIAKPVEPVHPTNPKNNEPEPVTSPKPMCTKPEVEKKQFAPTWHSMNQPYIDKEPIYAPTPRIFVGGKKKPKPKPPPPIKPKPAATSPTATSSVDDGPQYDLPVGPVYESIDNEPKEQIYLTIGDFTPGNAGDGLSFSAGVLVSVITKNPTGWWYVDLDGVEGWVPSSYLESTSKKPPSPVASTSPPPPLPARNSVTAPSKKELMSAFEKPARPVKTLTKSEPATKVKTFGDRNSKTSLRRSQSTESLDRDPPPKPSTRRANSPPAVHISSGSSWKPKPGPALITRPALSSRSPLTATRNEIKKPASSKTLSPRTNRLTKGQISDPMPSKSPTPGRHDFVAKSTSLQGLNTKSATSSRTLNVSKSSSSLHTPESNTRSTSVNSRPPKPATFASPQPPRKMTTDPSRKSSNDETHRTQPRKVSGTETAKRPPGPRRISESSSKPLRGDTTTSRPPPIRRGGSEEAVDVGGSHLSELEKQLRKRMPKPVDEKPKKATPPQRPNAPPSRPNAPPKRPDPPRPTATPARRPPPPRPAASPPVKRKVSYISVGDYAGEVDNCLTLSEGDWVNVIEKNDDGWWFVEIDGSQGWAPSSFLEEKDKPGAGGDKKPSKPPSRPKPPAPARPAASTRNGPTIPSRPRPPPTTKQTSDEHIDTPTTADSGTPKPKPRTRVAKPQSNFVRAISSYQVPAYEDEGVALVQGRLYEVKEKGDSGWWWVKDGDLEGWAPSSHLEPV